MSLRIKLQLPLEPTNRLVRWANAIRGFYGHPIYLVGSQITGAEDPRDVDIVCVIPDHEFALRYGPPDIWQQEGDTGMWGRVRWIWSDDCVKKTHHGMRNTGLFIDFKVWPASHHEGYKNIHERFPPHRLDTRPEHESERCHELSEKELLLLLNKKIDSFMSQTSDLLAKLGDDLDVIGTTVTGIATEIADLKSGQDDPAVVAKLTDLEGRASAVGTALKALLPAGPPADGGDTPPVETPPADAVPPTEEAAA